MQHLNPLFGDGPDIPFPLAEEKPASQDNLQSGVIVFAHVALQHHAIDVLPVGTVAGPKIFGN
jgi:hypothetical protein